jgi:hypothetical protein
MDPQAKRPKLVCVHRLRALVPCMSCEPRSLECGSTLFQGKLFVVIKKKESKNT